MIGERNSKFWDITLAGSMVSISYGKLGGVGGIRKSNLRTIFPPRNLLKNISLPKIKDGYFAVNPDEGLEDTSMNAVNESKISSNDDNSLPSNFVKLKSIFEDICELFQREVVEDEFMIRMREDFIKEFRRDFESKAWAWEPIVKLMDDQKIDRLGEVAMGPLFSSEEFPWPEQDGFPMAPLIQLNLEKASEIGSVKLGDGLLQVWMPHKVVTGPLFIRVIPKQAVVIDKLTPVVKIPKEMEPLQIREDTYFNFDSGKSEPTLAIQICGYFPKRLTAQFRFPIQDNFPLDSLTQNKETKLRIKEFDKLIKSLLKRGSKGFYAGGCHLFGTFVPIQSHANERSTPLFCFDSDEMGFRWGDGGNAQLFYDIHVDGHVTFSFEWNCT